MMERLIYQIPQTTSISVGVYDCILLNSPRYGGYTTPGEDGTESGDLSDLF